MDSINNTKKLENETIKQYKIKLFKNKDLYNLTSQNIADLINKETGDNFSESAYRKWYSAYAEGFRDAVESQMSNDNLIEEYEEKRIEFEKEKIRFSDQRTAYNKTIRDNARSEEITNIIQNAVDLGKIPKFEYKSNYIEKSDNDLLIGLNDIHFGIELENYWNKYNSEICKDRVNKYLNEIISIKQFHKSENCYVCANGDLISGQIHLPVALANRENIIEQVMGVSEIISYFLDELGKHFKNVYLSVVAGNHSRLGNKDNSLKGERMDDLIPWYIKARLQNIDNVHVLENNIDNTISMLNIRGKTYLGVHGDYDGGKYMTSVLSSMVDEKVYAVVTGHKHHNYFDTQQGIKIIMSGSFMGVDDYCIQKRLFGQPEQLVCVCDENGIGLIYDVQLS